MDRFWEKVDKSGECWLWTAGKESEGYGRFKLNGKGCKAHRISYELEVGPIPEGLQIDHLCRVRHCVNPEHLEAVTQRENILRGVGITARHAQATHCPQGHEYNEANTYTNRQERSCRVCNRVRHRVRYHRSKELAA
jgi:hypothetical protein